MAGGDRWALLAQDPDLDEEVLEARRAATELRDQANALCQEGAGPPDGAQDRARLERAMAMYFEADSWLRRAAEGRPLAAPDSTLALQCRLNGASLSLRLGDDERAERWCQDASELDPECPHVALFRLQVARNRGEERAAEQWLQRARRWAERRGDDGVLRQLEARGTAPSPGGLPAGNNGSVCELVRRGVVLLKDREPAKAQVVLQEAVALLDGGSRGPIEKPASLGERALAFDALEALAEALAAQGQWGEAVRCGERAALLLEAGGEESIFPVPENFNREGLLLFSLGHAALAGGGDPLPPWRRAASAWRRYQADPGAEGLVLLEIGRALVARLQQGGCDVDPDAAEEAISALTTAVDCFNRARSLPEGRKVDGRQSGLVLRHIQASTLLVTLLCKVGNQERARQFLEESRPLFDAVPEGLRSDQANDLSADCRDWALAAGTVDRLADAEHVLWVQWRLAGAVPSVELQVGALQALAVVRRRRRDESGMEEVLRQLEALLPAASRAQVLDATRRSLCEVAPVALQQGVGEDAVAPQLSPAVVGVRACDVIGTAADAGDPGEEAQQCPVSSNVGSAAQAAAHAKCGPTLGVAAGAQAKKVDAGSPQCSRVFAGSIAACLVAVALGCYLTRPGGH